MNFLQRLGNNIREQRKLKKFNQGGFAEYAKIGRRHYGFIERGEVNVSVVHLAKISLALDVPIALLLPENFAVADLLDCINKLNSKSL